MRSASYEVRLTATLAITFGLASVDRTAFGLLFPMMSQELGLTSFDLGAAAGVLALAMAISGVVASRLADRLHRRKTILLISLVLTSVFSLFTGLIAGLAGLMLARALLGFGEGPILPISQSLVAIESTPERRGLNMGILEAAVPALMAGILGPPAILGLSAGIGWRWTYALLFACGIMMSVAVAMVVKPDPVSAPPATVTTVVPARPPLAELLKSRNLVLCWIISSLLVCWFINIVTFSPTFLLRERGLNTGQLGMILAVVGGAGMLWGLAGAWMSDRIGRRMTTMLLAATGALLPFVLLYADGMLWLCLLAFLTMTAGGCFSIVMATIPAESIKAPGLLATSIAMTIGIGEVFGGFFGPLISGWLADTFGSIRYVMYICVFCAATAALLSSFLTETAPRRTGEPDPSARPPAKTGRSSRSSRGA